MDHSAHATTKPGDTSIIGELMRHESIIVIDCFYLLIFKTLHYNEINPSTLHVFSCIETVASTMIFIEIETTD